MAKYIITLTANERTALEQLVSVGKSAARKLTHARILLLADSAAEGLTDLEIQERLGTSVPTIARIRQRCVTCFRHHAFGSSFLARCYDLTRWAWHQAVSPTDLRQH